MSELNKITLSVGFGVAIIIGAALASYPTGTNGSSKKDRTLRGPASVEGKAQPRAQGKTSGLFKVDIKSLSGVVTTPGQDVDLEATVTALAELPEVQYAWNLPEGLTARSTDQGSLGHMQKGETKSIHFQASSTTSENRQIHLHVFRLANGEAKGSMTQYNTADQEQIETDIKSKAETLQMHTSADGMPQKITQ